MVATIHTNIYKKSDFEDIAKSYQLKQVWISHTRSLAIIWHTVQEIYYQLSSKEIKSNMYSTNSSFFHLSVVWIQKYTNDMKLNYYGSNGLFKKLQSILFTTNDQQ